MTNQDFTAFLQTLLQNKMQPLLGPDGNYPVLAEKLSRALQENLRVQADGIPLLPDMFTLIVSAEKMKEWQFSQSFGGVFKEALLEAAQYLGQVFAAPPNVSLTANASLAPNEVDLIASYRVTGSLAGLQPAENVPPAVQPDSSKKLNAFLILDGNKVFKLRQDIINLGRRLDNHVVLNDPRVSRTHAQIRLVKGRYIIFDLHSTGGTYINGQRITQSILYPGDVISLAGATLVYGQDSPPVSADTLGTQPLKSPPASADLPTAVIKNDPEDKP